MSTTTSLATIDHLDLDTINGGLRIGDITAHAFNGAILGGTFGFTGGLAAGALAGSIVPGLGTVGGGAAGAVIGGINGTIAGAVYMGHREYQRQRREEQANPTIY